MSIQEIKGGKLNFSQGSSGIVEERANESSSSPKEQAPLPKTVEEVRKNLLSFHLAKKLIELLGKDLIQAGEWGEDYPLCAKALTQGLFSEECLQPAIPPFLSLCLEQRSLRRIFCAFSSRSLHLTKLEGHFETLAHYPEAFFDLAQEALVFKNYLLLSSLLSYCQRNLQFIEKNASYFSFFANSVIHYKATGVVAEILDQGLEKFLIVENCFKGEWDLATLLINGNEALIDLLVKKDKVRGIKLRNEVFIRKVLPEKIDFLIANGVEIEKPCSSAMQYEKAYAMHQMCKKLHGSDLTEQFLKDQKEEDLWTWVCWDEKSSFILSNHSSFFKGFISISFPLPQFYTLALEKLVQAEIFELKTHGPLWLFRAISLKESAVVKDLVLRGVPLDWIDREGRNIFDLLFQTNASELLKLIIPLTHPLCISELGIAKEGNPIAHEWIQSYATGSAKKRETLLVLINYFAIRNPEEFERKNLLGETPLDLAKRLSLPEIALILLQTGHLEKRTCSDALSENPSQESALINKILNGYKRVWDVSSLEEFRCLLTNGNIQYFFGDAVQNYEVTGSSKEETGNSFVLSTTFLTALLTLLQKQDLESNLIKRAKKQLEFSIFCKKVLDLCLQLESFKKRFFPVFVSCIETQIQTLSPAEKILLPAGWVGREGCYHAMLVEISKEPEESLFSLCVINTDQFNDAQLHAKCPTALKTLIHPVRMFQGIPFKRLLETSFITDLFSLLTHIPENGSQSYSAKDLYHQLLWRFEEYSVASNHRRECFITAQRSGTCTMRSSLAYLYFFWGSAFYKKTKGEMEAVIFQALDCKEVLEDLAKKPGFLQHLEHGVERTALHLSKQNSGDLQSKEKLTLLLAQMSNEKTRIEIELLENDYAFQGSTKPLNPLELARGLGKLRAGFFQTEEVLRSSSAIALLMPPSLESAPTASGKQWIKIIDDLVAFFHQSEDCFLDPHRLVATHLATEVLLNLPLPTKGFFFSSIDENTLFGGLTQIEKTHLREQISILSQKYSSAFTLQKEALAKKERNLLYGDSFTDPSAFSESIEEYVCIYKLFAHYWRLSLLLAGEGGGGLSQFGIDISPLKALKESLHLSPYSKEAAKTLNDLIDFFESSHPARNDVAHTLFSIGLWTNGRAEISFPLKRFFEAANFQDLGENLLFEQIYSRLSEKTWAQVDQKRLRLQAWHQPDLKKWRLAHLFAHPLEISAASKDLQLYQELRAMALTCWFFKITSLPLDFQQVEWDGKKELLSVKFEEVNQVNLVQKASEAMQPKHMGKLAHQPLNFIQRSALEQRCEQNVYMTTVRSSEHKFYEIAQAKELAIHRLLSHYTENREDLKNGADQTFFQLVLFRNPFLENCRFADVEAKITSFLDSSLQEFKMQLQITPSDQRLLRSVVFLNFLKIRWDAHVPNSFPPSKREELQREIEKRLDDKENPLDPFLRAELLLLWICAQPTGSWISVEGSLQALFYWAQFSKHWENIYVSTAVDPPLKAFACRVLFSHLNDLKKRMSTQESLACLGRKICSIYEIAIDPSTPIEGTFPEISFRQGENLYQIHFLSGVVVRDQIPLNHSMVSVTNSKIAEFLSGRKDALTLYVLQRGETTRFYARSKNCEYHFINYDSSDGSRETQIEWKRDLKTFCYVPFDCLPQEIKRIPFSCKTNYYYWICKQQESAIEIIIQNRATEVEECILYADGGVERWGKSGRWNFIPVETIPELSQLAAADFKESVAVWDQIGSEKREIECFGLKDPQGVIVGFEGEKSLPLHLAYQPQYILGTKKYPRLFPFILIESPISGERKAILPIKMGSHFLEGGSGKAFFYEQIPLDGRGNFIASKITERLLLASYFIAAEKYDQALGWIKQSDSSRPYTPEELKMLGWVFLQPEICGDRSPKAISLSIHAAYLCQKNFESFPDSHCTSEQRLELKGFYDHPDAWVSFWKGQSMWKNSPSTVYWFLAKILERYYEVASHCTSAFQIHEKLLTPFQEAHWLDRVLKNVESPELSNRLHYLVTGKTNSIKIEPKAEFEMSFYFDDGISNFNWMHSIRSEVSEGNNILSSLNAVRPENGLRENFGKLYSLATQGAIKEKEMLLCFLKDLQYDPDQANQFIRAILMSQLPPYDEIPHSLPDGKAIRLSNAIDEKVTAIAANRDAAGSSANFYSGCYSSLESQLVTLVKKWCVHFFHIADTKDAQTSSFSLEEIDTLLPPLPTEKKAKMNVPSFRDFSEMISEMNCAAQELFISKENPISTTSVLPLPESLQKDPYFAICAKELREGIEEGKLQNQLKSNFCLKESNAEKALLLLQKWEMHLQSRRAQLTDAAKKQEEEIARLVSSVSGDRRCALNAQLLRLGKKEAPPTLNECIALFVQRDLSLYRERLGFLSESNCLELDKTIGEYLSAATTLQRITRSLEKLGGLLELWHKANEKSSIQSFQKPLQEFAEELIKKREFNPSKNPEMLVHEYYENFSLRKEQCDSIFKMTTLDSQGKYPPVFIQMPMSSGKTSVIGTLLALKKADGYHLSLLFVPRSLIDSNAAEMKKRNLTFFGQRGNTFSFDRSEECFSLHHLQKLYYQIVEAIRKREYIILTPETLLSMQNQYIEGRERIHLLRKQQGQCLLSEEKKLRDQIQRWQQPTQKLKQILKLINARGAATFDEQDSQRSTRRQFNYPGIEVTKLDPISIELVSALYEIASTDPEIKKQGLDLSNNNQTHLLPDQMQTIKELLARKMVQLIQINPLWCQHFGIGLVPEICKIQNLLEYFLNPHQEAFSWIAKLSLSSNENDRMAAERLVLMRQEMMYWLPSCWKCSAQEHFGRSKEHPEYLAAKPNISAGIPNENAEIAEPWELINKTLQLYVSVGVDLEQTKSIILLLQKEALAEYRTKGAQASIAQTTPMQRFKKIVEEASCESRSPFHEELMQIDTKDPVALRAVQKLFNAKTPESLRLIIHYLCQHALPQLDFHLDQIYNHSANLSGAVDSEQGYSGSADNPFLFSLPFLQDPKNRILLDKGAYGRVIDVLCRLNRTLHQALSSLKTPESYMFAFHGPKEKTVRNLFHAFIDIGAHFKSYTNEEVATSFLKYFSQLEDSPIRGILYFSDTSNQFACLKQGQDKPIFLDATDSKTIVAGTGLAMGQLFTYIGQFNTRGANIVQDRGARGFYTLGNRTTLCDMLQGCMRMRDLLGEERIEGIIPEELIPLMSHWTGQQMDPIPSIEQVLLFAEINGLFQAKEENPKAYYLKLEASLHTYVRRRLYASNQQEEENLYKAARSLFFKKMQEELFIQYGGVAKKMQRDAYIAMQQEFFASKIALIEPYLSVEEIQGLKKELHEIDQIAKGYLPLEMQGQLSRESEVVENVSSIEKQLDYVNELEFDVQKNVSSEKALVKPAEEIPWPFDCMDSLLKIFTSHLQAGFSAVPMHSLRNILRANREYAVFSDVFSSEFLVSQNFLETASGASNLFDSYQKTPFEALVFQDSEKYCLLLLTTQEARGFLKILQTQLVPDPYSLSLLNPDGSLRAGFPIDFSCPNRESLLIQMFFFSGRLALLEQEQWNRGVEGYLKENLRLKREFFESLILNDSQVLQYEQSRLKRRFLMPIEPQEDTAHQELKSAFFALKRKNREKVKKIVEKHFDLAFHHSDAAATIIDLLRFLMQTATSSAENEGNRQKISQILPHLPLYAKQGNLQPIRSCIEILKDPIPRRIKETIFLAIFNHLEESAFFDLQMTAAAAYLNFQIPENAEIIQFREIFQWIKEKFDFLKEHYYFKELYRNNLKDRNFEKPPCHSPDSSGYFGIVSIAGKQFLQACFPSGDECRAREGLDRCERICKALLLELEDATPTSEHSLILFAAPLLSEYFNAMHSLTQDCISTQMCFSKEISENLTSVEKRVLRFQQMSKKLCGASPLLSSLLEENFMQPLIRNAQPRSMDPGAAPPYFWITTVEFLKSLQILYATEQAENLLFQFEFA